VTALTIVFKAFEREDQLEPLEQKRGINSLWRKLCSREFLLCTFV